MAAARPPPRPRRSPAALWAQAAAGAAAALGAAPGAAPRPGGSGARCQHSSSPTHMPSRWRPAEPCRVPVAAVVAGSGPVGGERASSRRSVCPPRFFSEKCLHQLPVFSKHREK